MTHLKIVILLLFQVCIIAAGHGGGPFVMLWIFSIMGATSGQPEALIGLLVIALQILAIVAMKKSNERMMFAITVLLSLIVIAATVISRDNIGLVIWTNGAFLAVAGIYMVKYFKNLRQNNPDEIESALTE